MLAITLGLIPSLLLAANRWPPLTDAELEAGISACGAEMAAATERLSTQHSECTEDADCVAFAQVWLGCSGWRSIRTPFPDGLGAKLYGACVGLPVFGQNCSGNVGACVSGKCTGKARSGVGCSEATAALLQKAAEAATCKKDDDCATKWIDKNHFAVSTRFPLDGARAIHAREDACEEGPAAAARPRTTRIGVRPVSSTCAAWCPPIRQSTRSPGCGRHGACATDSSRSWHAPACAARPP
jgi:hypothetical protein